MELKTLIPVYGYNYYKDILSANKWTNDYFPNYPICEKKDVFAGKTIIQKTLELLLDNQLGDFLDKWFLNFSLKRRRKNLDPKHFENPNFYTNLKSYIAKSHITDTYPNIMKEYSQKQADL